MPKANLGDVEIYYEEQGKGEPILLAPASWWASDTWNVTVVPFLSQSFKTIIFDCRGTGRSSKPKDGYTVRQFAKDCIGLLAHLGISRCHAVGFALGGQIVQAMAVERPDLLATVTIAASGSGAKTLSGGPRNVSLILNAKFAPWVLSVTFALISKTTRWHLTLNFIATMVTW